MRLKTKKLIIILFSIFIMTAASAHIRHKPHHTPAISKEDKKFHKFLLGLEKEAREQRISEKTINTYLAHLKSPDDPVTKKIIKPAVVKPEKIVKAVVAETADQPFEDYLHDYVPYKSVLFGKNYMKQYHDVLQQIALQYHVQPSYIVSLWGFETYYGKNVGKSPMIPALVKLAYHHHRSQYFRDELMAALRILDRHYFIPQQKISTFDGGMGQTSFEPTDYFTYAVDFTHSGFKNIWTNRPDAFASIANFLHQNDWNENQPWGMSVKLPAHFPLIMANKKIKLSIADWQALGVRTASGRDLPQINSKAAIILPDGKNGRAFMVFHNFFVLLHWNNLQYEALSVGLLSNTIADA